MFFLNPDPFLLPSYRISPFTTSYVAENNELPENDFAVDYFDKRFGSGNWKYTYNGREAIELALENYQLAKDDIVTILTTSQNHYISSCVTKSIEKFCDWNREVVPQTKLIFINHEFGYPYPEMKKVLETGLPVIEDCCTTFFSQDSERNIGKLGDFSVYSFPKFFPIQIGGLLVSNKKMKTSESKLSIEQQQYVQNVISHHLIQAKTLLDKRVHNLEYALSKFSRLGFTSRFEKNRDVFPSALLLNNNSIIEDLNKLKTLLMQNGIQSSVFYGEDAFFIPCHQNLEKGDIDYIYLVVESQIKKNPITNNSIF